MLVFPARPSPVIRFFAKLNGRLPPRSASASSADGGGMAAVEGVVASSADGGGMAAVEGVVASSADGAAIGVCVVVSARRRRSSVGRGVGGRMH